LPWLAAEVTDDVPKEKDVDSDLRNSRADLLGICLAVDRREGLDFTSEDWSAKVGGHGVRFKIGRHATDRSGQDRPINQVGSIRLPNQNRIYQLFGFRCSIGQSLTAFGKAIAKVRDDSFRRVVSELIAKKAKNRRVAKNRAIPFAQAFLELIPATKGEWGLAEGHLELGSDEQFVEVNSGREP
jgi:hypothetical protein